MFFNSLTGACFPTFGFSRDRRAITGINMQIFTSSFVETFQHPRRSKEKSYGAFNPHKQKDQKQTTSSTPC